jgi:Tfp pilus assembly protein PilX
MNTNRCNQAGAASLVVTLILFGVMALVAAFANRNLLFEARSSLNQVRSTQAFEAAEASIEWSTAMLNDTRPIDAQCMATSDATNLSFRERQRAVDLGHTPLRATCVKSARGWTCSCATDGKAVFAADTPIDAPAFTLAITADSMPHTWRVNAVGCTSLSGDCLPAFARSADAVARVQATVASLPAIASLPVAALTARGSINTGLASPGFHNPDAASNGIAVHAGGVVTAAAARFTTAPGAAWEWSVIDHDASIASMTPDGFFQSFFGLPKPLWKQQPGVKTLRCDSSCDAALAAAVVSGSRMIWIDGDARVTSDLALGTRERPVIVVAVGQLTLEGAVTLHGFVYAQAIEWTHGGTLRGAAISESTAIGRGPMDFVRDAPILDALRNDLGSVSRLPGSWKDF